MVYSKIECEQQWFEFKRQYKIWYWEKSLNNAHFVTIKEVMVGSLSIIQK